MTDSGKTGFQFRYNLAGRTSGIQITKTIADSATITVGDMVQLSNNYIALAGAGAPILGVVVGLVSKNGISLANDKRALTGSGASYTASTRTVVAGSDNSSTDYMAAVVDIDPFSVWSGETDNGNTDGQTRLAGCFTDIIAASDQVDDDTAADNSSGQLFIWGADPDGSAKNLYSIAEHQIWQAT
jgi:hypothetical protein